MPKRSEKRDTAKAEYIAKKKKGEEVSLRALAGELGVSCHPGFGGGARRTAATVEVRGKL